jgi:type IV secretory system conjugative DNA transfer VirD4/TraG family protein
MLTQLFLAARAQNLPLMPYSGQMVRLGLIGTAKQLFRVAPTLATQFLDCELQDANFDDRFLVSAWGTLAARLRLLLTDSVVRSFSATDFSADEIMRGGAPVTVYLSWPERDLLMLSPLMRLMWDCFINELLFTFDFAKGANCRPVLLLIDEAGVSPIPNLPRFASTVCGRGMSLWVAVQALSQLEALYGKHGAETLIKNCDTQIYYRQSSQGTAEYLERCLGKQSGFAHSQSLHDGEEKSQGLAEQAVALMTAQEVKQLDYTDIVGFYANRPRFKAKRMDWRSFPVLKFQHPLLPRCRSLRRALPIGESHTRAFRLHPGHGSRGKDAWLACAIVAIALVVSLQPNTTEPVYKTIIKHKLKTDYYKLTLEEITNASGASSQTETAVYSPTTPGQEKSRYLASGVGAAERATGGMCWYLLELLRWLRSPAFYFSPGSASRTAYCLINVLFLRQWERCGETSDR